VEGNLREMLRDGGMQEAGALYGFYPGTVFLNTDPEGLGLVQVSCPVLTNNILDWMEVYGMALGSGEGSSMVPEIGCPVAVGFYGGNINSPFCIPRSFNRVTKPSSGILSVALRVIESKLFKLEWNDTANTMSLGTKTGVTLFKALTTGVAVVLGVLVELGGEGLLPTAGVVTGECNCAYTGAPHPVFSAVVRAKKV